MDTERLYHKDMMEKIDELLGHTEAILFWILRYSEKHNIPLDTGLDFHLSRISSLLREIANPPSIGLLAKVKPSDDSYHSNSSDDKLPKPGGCPNG